MLRWRHEHQNGPARLARRTAATRLGAEATGLETAGHRRRAGGDAGRRQPVAQTGTRAGRGGAAAPSGAGSHPQLSAEQLAQLPALLERGAEAYGFRGQVWTCRRVAEVIRRTFGVSVPSRPRQPAAARGAPQRPAPGDAGHPARRGGHCRRGGASAGRPRKKATDEGRTIVWVDQSGFYLLPLAVRTWAPCGQTPLLRVPLTHDHLAAISGITPDGRLFMQTQEQRLPLRRRRALPARAAAQDARQAAGHLGRRADPSRPARQGLPARGRRQAPASGAACRATRPNSTRTRASGTISSASSWATAAATTWPTWPWRCAGPKSACATSARHPGLFQQAGYHV